VKRISVVLATGALALGMGACGSDDEPAASSSGGGQGADESRKIGMANFTLGAPYFIGISKTVERAAEDAGNVDVSVTDAKGDAVALTSNIEDLLTKDLDGIIISGGPLENAPAALNAIKAAGIPVVLVDRKFGAGEYTSWVGPDNEAIGKQDGEFIAEELGGEGKVGIIRGGPADNSIGKARTDGVTSVLEPAGIELAVAPEFGEWSSDGGLKVAENLLNKHPDLDAIFCENDSMCLGAQKAIEDAGKTDDIFLAGVDGQKEALAAIKEGGNYKVTGLNSAVEMGNAAYARLMEILDGTEAEKDTVVPSPQITAENVEEHYDPNSEF
jgi:ribose transport system substrate-binding protein